MEGESGTQEHEVHLNLKDFRDVCGLREAMPRDGNSAMRRATHEILGRLRQDLGTIVARLAQER